MEPGKDKAEIISGNQFTVSSGSDNGSLTLLDCLESGLITQEQIEEAIIRSLNDSCPIRISPDIYAILPQFSELPKNLQSALVKIYLSART